MATIYSLVYLRIETNQEGIQNINGVLFICIMNCSFGTLFSVLNVSEPNWIGLSRMENKFFKIFQRLFQKRFLYLFVKPRMESIESFLII